MRDPQDARAGIEALFNQLPTTMEASQFAISTLATVGSVRRPEHEGGDVDTEKLTKIVGKALATMAHAVLSLENRVEKLEGRPGIPDDLINAVLSEFRTNVSE